MAINRAQLVKELVPGLHALFGLEYDWKSVPARLRVIAKTMNEIQPRQCLLIPEASVVQPIFHALGAGLVGSQL